MPIQTYPFTNTANYNKSNVVIDSGVAKLALVDNVSQTFNQDFSSDNGFAYDNNLAEFSGGKLQQKDRTPLNSRLGTSFGTINANWNKDDAVTATLNGTPSIVSGKLQCFGVEGITYPTVTMSSGAIKFKYTPNYNVGPATNVNVISLLESVGNNNRLVLTNSPSGNNWRIFLNNAVGTSIYNATTIGGTWSAVAGTEYEIELNWDNVAGTIRLFINGIQHGLLSPGAFSRVSGNPSVLSLGATTSVYNTADAEFDDVILFDAAQHSSAYTPGYSVVSSIYGENKIDIPSFLYNGAGNIQSLTSATSTLLGSPRFTLKYSYWNGSSWAPSNGTYAESSSFSDVLTNIGQLDVLGDSVLSMSVIFQDSNSQSSVDDFTVEYTGQQYSPTGYLEPVQALNVQQLLSYSHDSLETINAYVRVILKIDGDLTYWNGSAWVDSNGTEAQSNTESDILTNIPSLTLGSNSSVFIRWLLVTSVETETPELDTSDINYDFGGVEIELSTCLVYGYYKDLSDNPVSGATVKFSLSREKSQYQEANNNIVEASVETTTDVNGYFEMTLIRTSEYSVGGTYKVEISKKNPSLSTNKNSTQGDLTFTVPDAETKDITDLLP